jgi:hypothetical protein
MSTRLLENMVEFSIPADFAHCLFPERSPALRNGRGGKYELPQVSGMELCMTFIRTMEYGWKLRNSTPAKQRISMSARCVRHLDSGLSTDITKRELRARLGSKYDQYLDVRSLLNLFFFLYFTLVPTTRCSRTPASSP